jgi:hypothetical protein
MKRAIPIIRFPKKAPLPPRRGFRCFVLDETVFDQPRSRPETNAAYCPRRSTTGAGHVGHYFRSNLRTFHRSERCRHDPPESKAVIGRSASPGPDAATVWLAGLIDAMETVDTRATPCDPSISRALQHRLNLPGLLQASDRPSWENHGPFS